MNYQMYAADVAIYLIDTYPDIQPDVPMMDFVNEVTDYGKCESCRTFTVNKPLHDIDTDGEFRNVGLFCGDCIDKMEPYFNQELHELVTEAEEAAKTADWEYRHAVCG